MRFVDFFSGIGGFRLGLERAGHTCVAHSEIDPYASAVYNRHWPGSLNLGDITKVRPELIPDADLWCGGIPCQPFSIAGSREGLADPRHLWPDFYSIVRVLRPRHILIENVAAILNDGAARGILRDLAACGYDAEWAVIPACRFGAKHKRARVWVLATRMEHTDNQGLEGIHETSWRVDSEPTKGAFSRHNWSPTPRVCRGFDGLPNKVDRIRCLGNAVVPQVVEWIGRRIG